MHLRTLLRFLAVMLVLLGFSKGVQAQQPVVQAVLFYSPTCSYCHYVMTEVLPPLREQYGDALVVAEIDVTQPSASELFQAAIAQYEPSSGGVPALVIGEYYLLGGEEIPEQLPGLIETYLAQGGVAWPELPNVEAVVAELGLTSTGQKFTWREIYARDVTGNTISTMVLVCLIIAFIAVLRPHKWQHRLADRVMPWAFWVVLSIGLLAAIYLAYVETTHTEAVCGPVGDCNAVQQSEYALLFGFLPVAVLGVLGYIVIVASYLYSKLGKQMWVKYLPAITFFLTLFGLAFSIYLTVLEPFVIGATCMWCLTSAVSMMLLALLTSAAGWEAASAWQGDAWRRRAARHRAAKSRARKRRT